MIGILRRSPRPVFTDWMNCWCVCLSTSFQKTVSSGSSAEMDLERLVRPGGVGPAFNPDAAHQVDEAERPRRHADGPDQRGFIATISSAAAAM